MTTQTQDQAMAELDRIAGVCNEYGAEAIRTVQKALEDAQERIAALESQPAPAVPDGIEEFSTDQWWYQSLERAADSFDITNEPNRDIHRAVKGVVPKLIAQAMLAAAPQPPSGDFDRAPETSRRMKAVETMIAMGWNWHNGEWVKKPASEDKRDAGSTPIYCYSYSRELFFGRCSSEQEAVEEAFDAITKLLGNSR